MVRFKNRYVLCEMVFPDKKNETPQVDTKTVYNSVRDAILDANGDFGLAYVQDSLSVKYLNVSTNIVIIRVQRQHLEILTTSIVFIRKIGIHNVIMRTLHVGGSIRTCQKFLIAHHRKMLLLYYSRKIKEIPSGDNEVGASQCVDPGNSNKEDKKENKEDNKENDDDDDDDNDDSDEKGNGKKSIKRKAPSKASNQKKAKMEDSDDNEDENEEEEEDDDDDDGDDD